MVSEVNTKALTYMNPESFTDAAGNIKSIASVKGEEQVCILEIPVGASIAGTKITEKFIQIGLNSSSYANLTNDALSIVRNACNYLMGMNSGLSNTDTFKSTATGMNIYVSSGILNISFDNDGYDKANISIIGITGKIISQETIETIPGRNNYQTSLSGMASGVYMISVESNGIHHVAKFIVKQ